MSDRYATAKRPVHRPSVVGETAAEAKSRRAANRADRELWAAYYGTRCAECRMVRFHVSHEMDPDNSPEGPAYHADFAHHAFVEPR